MSGDRDEKIRQRAHEIWDKEGRPEGEGYRHWAQAEKEIDAEAQGAEGAPKKAAARKPAAAKKAGAPETKAAPKKASSAKKTPPFSAK